MTDLETVLDSVLQLAQLILRNDQIQQGLHSTRRDQRIEYWIAFFQVILAYPFGIVIPSDAGSMSFRESIDDVRRKVLESHPELANRIPVQLEWDNYSSGQEILYTVAQFWNADDRRSAAFVINQSSQKITHADLLQPLNNYDNKFAVLSTYWRDCWGLMSAINDAAEAHAESSKLGSSSGGRLAPVSIGNFIVQRSRDSLDTCSVFKFLVGPDSNFKRFEKDILSGWEKDNFDVLHAATTEVYAKLEVSADIADSVFESLEAPDEIVRILLCNSHRLPRLPGEQTGETEIRLSELGKSQPPDYRKLADLVIKLSQNENDKPTWDVWQEDKLSRYVQYVRCFFLWKYPIDSDDKEDGFPANAQLRLMILNNLLVTRPVLNLANEFQGKDPSHFQYFFPTFHKLTSYLAVVTRKELLRPDLDRFRKFAERLFSLTWAHDSDRKLEEDREQIILRTERAARAAILARNFSHTVGSHVLNSPGFAMALTQGDRAEDLNREMKRLAPDPDPDSDDDASADSVELTRKLVESRNLLREARKVFDAGLNKTTTFHRFLQGRFDFIARAIEERPYPAEPVFFVEDLIEGFFSQTVFLDHLVKDLGWSLHNLTFHLYLPYEDETGNSGEAIFQSVWKDNEDRTSYRLAWKPENGTRGTVNDCAVLIGLPGGGIAAHAFYAILENVIRNSFKYGVIGRGEGQEDAVTYGLNIRLSHQPGGQGWRLQLWDNFSSTEEPTNRESTFNRIETYLRDSIVNPETGELSPEGLGIKEMVLCARTLFNPRKECANHPIRLIPPSELESVSHPALKNEKHNTERPLVFELSLEEPVLLAIYDESGQSQGWIRRCKTLNDLGRSGAHIAILPGDQLKKLLESIIKVHPALPYRLLVVCRDAKQVSQLANLVQKSELPRRRLHFYEEHCAGRNSLYDFVLDPECEKAAGIDNGQTSSETWICRAYEAWLRAWKGVPEGGKWHLWIGFERSPGDLAPTWGKLLSPAKIGRNKGVGQPGAFERKPQLFRSDLISIVLKSRSGEDIRTWLSDPEDQKMVTAADENTEKQYWKEELKRPYIKKAALVFDNHGACFNKTNRAEQALDYQKSTRFYQQTSGGKTFDLFQRLFVVPSNPFGFSFFVYNLVESCLTVMAVADERVAADLLFTSASLDAGKVGMSGAVWQHFKDRLAQHQKTGVFPLFQLRLWENTGEQIAHYSLRHAQAFEKIMGYKKGKNSNEGIYLRPEGHTLKVVVPEIGGFREEGDQGNSANIGGAKQTPPIDFLLVHEGAVDMFRTNNKIAWDWEVTKALFEIAPGVVRTSGRGRHSRNLGERIPFVEASVLTAALVTSRNKYELARALLGSVAEMDSQV
jgi:hypothetical protein